jgi:hypothetical protein
MPVESCTAAAEELCEAHKIDIESIKEERDTLKEKADKAKELETELAEAKNSLAELEKNKTEYENTAAELAKLKESIASKEAHTRKENAITAHLKSVNIPEKWHSRILKTLDFDGVELDKDGTIKNLDKLDSFIDSEWGDTKTEPFEEGYNSPKPPKTSGANAFGSMSLAEKMAFAEQHPGDAQVTEWLRNPTATNKEG